MPPLDCRVSSVDRGILQAVNTIFAKLGKKFPNVTQTSCTGGAILNKNDSDDPFSNDRIRMVSCDCNISSNTFCHVTDFDLTRNYINGPIPPIFGRFRNLTILSLLGNRISGKIPKEIADISTLEELVLQDNEIQGPLDQSLGNLSRLRRLLISGNNVSGVIPESFGKLKNMTDFRIDGNPISGNFPDFIGNWTNLEKLDLSFNMLSGPIPNVQNKKFKSCDLSYNNFTESSAVGCQTSTLNLVSTLSSYSVANSDSGNWCLKKDLPCAGGAQYDSLYINCGGGSAVSFEGKTYEADSTQGGPSYLYTSSDRWGYSSSGVFIANDDVKYLATNTLSYTFIHDIYKTARLAPTSLKYYGFCMRQGSYKVRLHFAEIMFSNNSSYSSLGRRLFDVSIQGNVVLTDFNIAEDAKGAGIAITKEFDNVLVNGSSLEIHLYWTGKGTNAIPMRSVYGPLISAITITPNFKTNKGLGVGAIVGISISCCVFVLLILVVLWLRGYLGGKVEEDNELRTLDLQTGYFTLRQVKTATNNFDPANKIGEGGFGPVYKGILSDGGVVAVKQLSSKSKQGNREFVNEIGMISALQHPNLVKLYGCCIEGNQLLLIYEYMENNCLSRALFGRPDQRLSLDWETRKKICMGIAKGLAYLHEESRLKIVHRDIKASNVLLDKDLSAKISDFGLAKLDEEENTHISTRIAGTVGYMAPEYAMRGYLTDKADVYSFGIVALEIVSGKSNTNYRPKEEFVYLLDWAYVLEEQGNLLELVDQSLGSNYSKKEAMRMLRLALLCANPSPSLRPSMSSVVKMLEGKMAVQAPAIRPGKPNGDPRFKALEKLSQDSHTNSSSTYSQDTTSQLQRSVSVGAPWSGSSQSFASKDEHHHLDGSSPTRKLLPDLYDVSIH
ncbi:unnamed protein product [Cuscuta campestris]|uniref:non-specific serine/threonine protein kinase n=1 Tax=Cuscuta campestris TaxID=132261 RepID=A0A484KEW2_9ASTE|nr:unnamed protein product [Cuscuta campestris]